MSNRITIVVEICPDGTLELPSLSRLQNRFEAVGPLAGLGEITSVRVALGSYQELLAAQTRRVQSIRAYCAKELAALDELERDRAA